MVPYLDYEVKPGDNVPEGLPRLRLAVLSPVWRGAALHLKYPDGEVHTLMGRSGPDGESCEVRVFWTRQQPPGPAVCLAIGGDAGLRLSPAGSQPPEGLPFLALAESLIPPEVLAVIGPPPQTAEKEPAPLLLL